METTFKKWMQKAVRSHPQICVYPLTLRDNYVVLVELILTHVNQKMNLVSREGERCTNCAQGTPRSLVTDWMVVIALWEEYMSTSQVKDNTTGTDIPFGRDDVHAHWYCRLTWHPALGMSLNSLAAIRADQTSDKQWDCCNTFNPLLRDTSVGSLMYIHRQNTMALLASVWTTL